MTLVITFMKTVAHKLRVSGTHNPVHPVILALDDIPLSGDNVPDTVKSPTSNPFPSQHMQASADQTSHRMVVKYIVKCQRYKGHKWYLTTNF